MSGSELPPTSFENSLEIKEETPLRKFFRRLKQEPLVPLGCGATCYALYRAYRSMKSGDSGEMNRMFRARIYAQAFTLVAVVAGGMYYRTERQQRREFEQMLDARKSQEKRDAWLRELEIRDQEDREWRERHAAIQIAAKEAGMKKNSKESPESTTTTTTTTVPTDPDSKLEKNDDSAASVPGNDSEEKKGDGILDSVKALVSGKK